jgi:hypothetical protein
MATAGVVAVEDVGATFGRQVQRLGPRPGRMVG